MKIATLDLLAYGHFHDLSLDFRAPGLHVVFGPNEAGKSTTLRAITGLLYGIDVRTRDAHVHKPADLRIGGALVGDDGEPIRVVRLKRNVDPLLDANGKRMDEAKLLHLLRGVTEETFRQAFGLDHETLKKGAEALLAGRGDLGESLFDASVGAGGDVQRLLAELSDAADSIYRPRGSTRPLNEALKAVSDAQKQIREKQSLPEAYTTQERALDEAEAQRSEFVQKKTELGSRRAQIERARTRIPLERKRARLLEVRTSLSPFATHAEKLLSLPARLVDYDRTSHALRELRAQLENMRDRVTDAARRTGTDAIGVASFDEQTATRIQRLVQECITLASKIDSAEIEMSRSRRELQRLREQASQTENGDATKLLHALRAAQALGDAEDRLAKERARAARKRAELSKRAASLGLFDGSIDELVILVVPSPETIDRLASRALDLERLRARQDARLSDKTDEALMLARQIAEHTGDFAPPSQSDLREARERRDEAWAQLRAQQRRDIDDEERARREAGFEQTMRDVDALADQMLREADRVTALARLGREALALAEEKRALDAEREETAKALALLDEEHRAAWRRAGIEALGVVEMKGWLDRHAKIVEGYALIQEAEAAAADLEAEITRARTDLEAALASSESPAKSKLTDLVLEATSRIDRIEAAKHAQTEAARSAAKLEAEIEERALALEKDECELATIKGKLAEIVRPFGVPDEASPDEITRALEQQRELRSLVDKRGDLERRACVAESEARAFEEEIARLTRELAPDLAELGARDRMKVKEPGPGFCLAPDLAELGARDAGAVIVERAQRARDVEQELASIGEQLEELGSSPLPNDVVQLAEDPDVAARAIEQIDGAIAEVERELHRLVEDIGGMKKGLEAMRRDSGAAEASALAQQALARTRSHVDRYCRARLAQFLLSREIDRYREAHQGPLLAHTSELFARLTLGGFSGVRAGFDDRDRAVLHCVRRSANGGAGASVEVSGLSDGTRHQLYLSLRLASLRRYVEISGPMPLVLDDVLVDFDDDRSRAALAVLAETSAHMQVLFFTHHARAVDLAREAVPQGHLHIHELRPLS
ncbi:MAG: AAA family ATPase [Polyangiaceae bacterium]|nr:AAA family ATPase [Polyangiaceae bacterium]